MESKDKADQPCMADWSLLMSVLSFVIAPPSRGEGQIKGALVTKIRF